MTLDEVNIRLTTATYDRIARQFAERWYSNSDFNSTMERFARAIAGDAPTGRYRILDAGCGPGQASRWFHDRGFQVVGVDRSEGMLAEARRRSPQVEFQQADLRSLPFPESTFDGIWCSAALLHLPRSDVQVVLRSFNRLLGHGYLWVSVKLGTGEEIDTKYGSSNPRTFTYFERLELELYLERANFEIHEFVESEPTADLPRPWLRILSQTAIRTPLLGVAAIVFDESGRVLLSERADGRGWNLPGGFVDADEGPDDGVVREVREETGLDIVVERLVGISTSPRYNRGFGPPVSGTLVSHAFICRVIGGELTPTNEALRHGWFEPNALPSPMSSRRHVDLIDDAVNVREGHLTEPTIRRYRSPTGVRAR